MKAKRFLAMLLMGCLAVLTLFSFMGCGENGANGAEELKKQIAELTTQVQTLETALKEEQDKNAENQAKLDELEASLKTEQGKNAESEKALTDNELYIRYLSGETLNVKMADFPEAYSLQWLTKEDFMNIAYYRHGKVTVQEDGAEKEIDFQPTIEQSEMSDRLEKILKAAISQAYQETYGFPIEEEDVTIIQYFGVYNESHAVEYQIEGINKGSAVMPDAIVDNIVFGYSPNNMLGIIKFD